MRCNSGFVAFIDPIQWLPSILKLNKLVWFRAKPFLFLSVSLSLSLSLSLSPGLLLDCWCLSTGCFWMVLVAGVAVLAPMQCQRASSAGTFLPPSRISSVTSSTRSCDIRSGSIPTTCKKILLQIEVFIPCMYLTR